MGDFGPTLGALVALLIYVLVPLLAWFVIKSAVRQGVIEAYTKLGLKRDESSTLSAEMRAMLTAESAASDERKGQ